MKKIAKPLSSTRHGSTSLQGGRTSDGRNAFTGGLTAKFQPSIFCREHRINNESFARLTGFSLRAIANWRTGRAPSESSLRRLTELKRLIEGLEKVMENKVIGPWLREANPAFDGSTPLQIIERGEIDQLWRMLYELESGEPS